MEEQENHVAQTSFKNNLWTRSDKNIKLKRNYYKVPKSERYC